MIDCAAFIGPYPFRQLPHPDPEVLVRVLAREGLAGAWVGYLPAPWQRDPQAGNDVLLAALAPYSEVLQPAPVVRPDWPRWEQALRALVEQGAPAIRAYPMHWGMGPHDASMRALALACGELGVPLLLTVRFEDLRQRGPLDVASDLTAAHVRALARADARVRLVVTCAGRELIEETHWGLTPDEQRRVLWDFSWVWGPPEDHLAHLLRTMGPERFVYGTGWPLRLPDDVRGAAITDVARMTGVRKTPT